MARRPVAPHHLQRVAGELDHVAAVLVDALEEMFEVEAVNENTAQNWATQSWDGSQAEGGEGASEW